MSELVYSLRQNIIRHSESCLYDVLQSDSIACLAALSYFNPSLLADMTLALPACLLLPFV